MFYVNVSLNEHLNVLKVFKLSQQGNSRQQCSSGYFLVPVDKKSQHSLIIANNKLQCSSTTTTNATATTPPPPLPLKYHKHSLEIFTLLFLLLKITKYMTRIKKLYNFLQASCCQCSRLCTSSGERKVKLKLFRNSKVKEYLNSYLLRSDALLDTFHYPVDHVLLLKPSLNAQHFHMVVLQTKG